jgi:trk system potassium uptake protein TrkH
VQAVRDLTRALYPHLAHDLRLAGQPMTPAATRAVWAAFGLGTMVFAGLIIAVSPFSGTFAGAYMVAIGVLSNTTQIAALAEGVPPFSAWPDHGKLVVAAGLVLARVEALAALALLHLALWRR